MKACPVVFCALAVGVAARAQVFENLSTGNSSDPSVISFDALAGGGKVPNAAGLALDTANQTLHINFAWGDAYGLKDLKGSFTGANLSTMATSHTAAGVVYDLTPYVFQQSPTDGGIFALSLHLHDVGSYTVAQQQEDLLQSHWFINIQSSVAASGEIRSQLAPVPEPAEYAGLAGLGLLGFALARRVRAQRRLPCPI